MNSLYIDTSDNKKTIITLSGRISKIVENETIQRGSQVVLPTIEKMLEKNNLTIDDVTEIQVHTGPGSFTGLRVGIAIAQALGFAKKISVNGKNIGEYIDPQYT